MKACPKHSYRPLRMRRHIPRELMNLLSSVEVLSIRDRAMSIFGSVETLSSDKAHRWINEAAERKPFDAIYLIR